ncbi:MAG: acyltransferase family protein [Vicinamibacterales bacterium]
MNERTTRAGVEALPALTGIRFPLALWVVLHHLSGPGRLLDPVIAPHVHVAVFIDAAWAALSAFFAISGFLLARRYAQASWTRPALARFAVARFARIYPLYALSLVILLPIMREALSGGELGSPFERVGIVLNYVLLLQAWQRPPVDWNTPAWSLSCEVFFYACTPILVGLVRRPSLPRLLGTALLACAVPIALRLLIAPPIPKAILYLGDFLMGVAAAGLFARLAHGRTPLSRIGPWLYLPALIVGAVWLIMRDSFESFAVFDTGVRVISVLLVLGLACGGGRLVALLSTPLVQLGGRASFAVYILHIPLLWWFKRSAVHAVLPPVYAGVLYLALVLVVAVAASRWFEEPMNAFIRRSTSLRSLLRRGRADRGGWNRDSEAPLAT